MVAADIARAIALQSPRKPLQPHWRLLQEDFRRVKEIKQFEEVYLKWTRIAYRLNGGW
jgi:hypothetical protein